MPVLSVLVSNGIPRYFCRPSFRMGKGEGEGVSADLSAVSKYVLSQLRYIVKL
ncbi:hypothetical protein kam1_160 [Methylacidiphilum kamchatkense Kam1]|uniref:Uncharacterized protein n=1 Tax=Methylacidiphilum kamchatkense Kam1 TaxID=1202785 RepID=A0A516TJJ5_9BACT|nr:hypothetical protein kam1_160 [Methylacidiphilum kamchatkense Kam1]